MKKSTSKGYTTDNVRNKMGGSKLLKPLLVVYCSLMGFQQGMAQERDSLEVQGPQIVVMARPTTDGTIMLRWAVTTARAWRRLNTYGYGLERYTVTRGGATLPEPVGISLGTFRPAPLEEWMPIIETNDNAAVMAQSLYGDSFDVEGQDELSAIVNLAEEQEQRFTWGLYAADQDFGTARMAGLAHVDDNARANEKYVYKVTSLVPESEMAIGEGGVFIGPQDREELPKPLDLAGIFMDGKTMLSWNHAIHDQVYNSYFVERSSDGTTFDRLNDLPLTRLDNGGRSDAKRMFFIDSITNGRTYRYRVLGRTVFGELGPVSEVVSGKGEELLAYVPHLTTKDYLDDKSVVLEWEFPEEGNGHITGFELGSSDKVDGDYEVLVDNIPPEARRIRYDNLLPTNYMTITAIGRNGSKRASFPALVQPVDSVPPVRPTGLKGTIDSLGVVTLEWDANREGDMLGYRVFRGNNRDEEYTQITVSPHRGTIYYDSVSVKDLNSKVYYRLIAVDQRFNMSEPSEILEIKKPDFIRPTSPVFKSYNVKEGKVHLSWANSSSEDVIKHELYRKEKDSTDWKLVYTLDGNRFTAAKLPTEGPAATAQWTDENTEEGKQYSYTMVATDDSGLESDPAPPLTVIVPRTDMPPAVKGLDSYIDRKNGFVELYWRLYKEDDVAWLMVYKGTGDGPVALLRHVAPTARRIVDDKVRPNNGYFYMVRPVFKDGRMGRIAKLNVKY